jgi:hypothetical protein
MITVYFNAVLIFAHRKKFQVFMVVKMWIALLGYKTV